MTMQQHPRLSTPKLAVLTGGLLFLLTMVALVGVVLTRNDSARAVSEATYVQNINLWHLIREGCDRNVLDRQASIRLLTRSAVANQAVADDNINTRVVRRDRGLEAESQRSAVRGLKAHVPPAFSCVRAYPKPRPPRGITPRP